MNSKGHRRQTEKQRAIRTYFGHSMHQHKSSMKKNAPIFLRRCRPFFSKTWPTFQWRLHFRSLHLVWNTASFILKLINTSRTPRLPRKMRGFLQGKRMGVLPLKRSPVSSNLDISLHTKNKSDSGWSKSTWLLFSIFSFVSFFCIIFPCSSTYRIIPP